MGEFSNLVSIKANIEETLYKYIKQEFNDNSFDVDFEMGFWSQYHDTEQTKRISVEGSQYLKKDKQFTPMAIEVFDGDILAIEGMFNAEYTIPLSFEVAWDDKEYADRVINAIEEVKNRHRGQIRRLNVPIDEETNEEFTMVVTANNLTPVGNVSVRAGREYLFASLNFYFDISKDIIYGNQVRVFLSYLGSEQLNFEWEPTSPFSVPDYDIGIGETASEPSTAGLKLRQLDNETFEFNHGDDTSLLGDVFYSTEQTVENMMDTFSTSGAWQSTQDDGKQYTLVGQNGYVVATENFIPGTIKELVPITDGTTNYNEEVVLEQITDLQDEIDELDFETKEVGYRYGFTYNGNLFVIYEVVEETDQHFITYGSKQFTHDRLVTDYSSETSVSTLKHTLDTTYSFTDESDGERIAFQYGGASDDKLLFSEVEVIENYSYFVSVQVEDEEEPEEFRIYPLTPSLSRDNTPETIQNFQRTQSYSIIQESEYDVTFAIIFKDDDLHWQIMQDIVNKNFLQDRYKLRLEFNRYNSEGELVPKFEFIDEVVIINGLVNFSIGEEMSGVVSFKKFIKDDE